jgi:hypothetical protein
MILRLLVNETELVLCRRMGPRRCRCRGLRSRAVSVRLGPSASATN